MGSGQGHINIFVHARRGAHGEAFNELATVTGISAMPFLIGLFAFLFLKGQAGNTTALVLDYLATVFLRGQLFLIAVSYLATSLHRLFASDRSYRRPDIIVVFSFLLFGLIGIFYGVNPSFAAINSSWVENSSLLFLFLSLVFYYYTAVLAYERPQSIEESLAKDTNDLGSKLAARRLGGDAE